MIILEVVIIIIIAFLLFLVCAGIGIFFIAIDDTEVGKAINEKLVSIIRRGKDEQQTERGE